MGHHSKGSQENFWHVFLLQVFSDMVLVPAGLLGPHVSCFNKFCTIVDVMKMGDETVKLAANHRGTPQFVYWDLWRKECNPQDALYTAFGTRVGQATGQFELFPHRAETSTMQSNRIKSFCKL